MDGCSRRGCGPAVGSGHLAVGKRYLVGDTVWTKEWQQECQGPVEGKADVSDQLNERD